jgi:hypothetical protein
LREKSPEAAVVPNRKSGAGKRIREAAKDVVLEVVTLEQAKGADDEVDDDEEEDVDVRESDVGAAESGGVEEGDHSKLGPGHHGRKKLPPERVRSNDKFTLGETINHKNEVDLEII